MGKIYGIQATKRGIAGNIKIGAGTVWAGVNHSSQVTFQRLSIQPVADIQYKKNQSGRKIAAGVDEVDWEVQIDFLLTGDTGTPANTSASIKSIRVPEIMALIELENCDNTDINGIYNVQSAQFTEEAEDAKMGTMTLRKYDSGNQSAASAVSFATLT